MAWSKLSNTLNKQPILWFLVFPAAIELTLIGMYFSGIRTLQSIIVPEVSTNKYINREFGLLENLQNLVLLIIAMFVVRNIIRIKSGYRWIGILLAMGAVFFFLEEIDYGWHYRELIFGLPEYVKEGYFRNIHNSNDGLLRRIIQTVAMVSLIGLFILLPILKGRSQNLNNIKLIPGIPFSISGIGLLVITGVAYLLEYINPDMYDPLNNNTGEFTELWYYYLAFLYIVYLRDQFIDVPEKE